MNNAHTNQLRDKFFEFVGEEQFEKFVKALTAACQEKHRLMFWQEEVWNQFLRENSLTVPIGIEYILEVFSPDIAQMQGETAAKRAAFRKKLDEDRGMAAPKCVKCGKDLFLGSAAPGSLAGRSVVVSGEFFEAMGQRLTRQPRACLTCRKNFCSACAHAASHTGGYACPLCGNHIGDSGSRSTFIEL